jgi:polysaccharide export outer membrane protein
VLHKSKTILIASVAALFLLGVQAQAVTPSPQMLEQFKQLSKSEQIRIAKQYGIDPAELEGNSSTQSQNLQMSQSDIGNRNGYPTNQQAQFDQQSNANLRNPYSTKNEPMFDFTAEKDKDELKRFGYDMFSNVPVMSVPISDTPVPAEYLVGPGDSVKVQLFGKENKEYRLQITREGTIQFPDLGPIVVNGLNFSELKALINNKIKQKMIGVESNVSMGELRSIRVFIAGDAHLPGSYTVSSLSTITQALFVAGGINEIGSLRNIQLKRSGRLIGSLDLYDLLLDGDASKDLNLRSGDVVFIPPVKKLVSITGEVRRPAIYELKNNENYSQALEMAGGLQHGAFANNITVERFNTKGFKSVISLNLTSEKDLNSAVYPGDFVRVGNASNQYDNAITVVGAVVRPGKYQWHENVKVSDLLPSLWSDLKVSADLDYALIVREINEYGDIEALQFKLGEAITVKNSPEDLVLQARDKIIIFNYEDVSQSRYELNKLVKERIKKITDLTGDSLIGTDLFKAGFDVLNRKDKSNVEKEQQIAGVYLEQKSEKEQELVTSEVGKMLLNLFEDKDLIALSDVMNRSELLYAVINKLIIQSRKGEDSAIVAINGQVRHEGVYPLSRNGKINDLILAAGGLKEGAYKVRAELTRTENVSNASLISHLQVNLNEALQGNVDDNFLLKGRDSLMVLTTPDWQEQKTIEIKGEVKFPGIYSISRGESLGDLLKRAGGFTDYAFPQSAVFVRDSVKKQEELEIKKLANLLRRDIATKGVSSEKSVINYADANMMLSDLENLKSAGRLVVDLNAISIGIKDADLQLEDEDILYIPSLKQTVAVMGEVQHPSTHRFKKGITLSEYLTKSGGLRQRADAERVYIVKADGSVVLPSRSIWFESDSELDAGDTVIVPLDTEYKDGLALWTQVTTIIYNTAVAFASIANL